MATYLVDDHITHTTNMTSPHLDGVPHAYIVTTPTFSPVWYGLTLLASIQLRWTIIMLEECIPAWIPESLRNPLLAQVPTITCKHVDKPINAKDT
jgi:hypothetical protein